ncbi:MAG: LysM peptidoglycan-binding domain-containing protein, partial [Terrabacter sp.]
GRRHHRDGSVRLPCLAAVAAALSGLAVAVAALRMLTVVAARGTGAPAGAARPDDLLLLLLSWLGVALAGWLGLGSLLALLAALPGTAGRISANVAERITPMAARKALTLVLGASVGSVALPPAQVSSAGSAPVSAGAARDVTLGGAAVAPHLEPGLAPRGLAGPGPGYVPTGALATAVPHGNRPSITSAAPTPGFVPTPNGWSESTGGDGDGPGYIPSAPRPVLTADRSRLLAPSPRPTASTHDVVTVRRGDTLWSVAARHLGPDATDAHVAREWPRWYAANRDLIGDDPDLLVPGQQLRPPSDVAHVPTVARTAPVPVERGAHR